MMATVSPRAMPTDTPASAWTCPKFLVMPRVYSSGADACGSIMAPFQPGCCLHSMVPGLLWG